MQSWVALPQEHERTEPRFEHHPAASVPKIAREGASLEVVVGTAYGARSPVGALSPTLYVHAHLQRGAHLAVDDGHEERAVYVVEGAVACDGEELVGGALAILAPGAHVELQATAESRVMLVGGARLQGERHIEWNFVSSSRERIERAMDDWEHERFPTVPGDEKERIPLPPHSRARVLR
jgi:redox-sensitive bicupin YhaK (pirin superfamily)